MARHSEMSHTYIFTVSFFHQINLLTFVIQLRIRTQPMAEDGEGAQEVINTFIFSMELHAVRWQRKRKWFRIIYLRFYVNR